MQRIKVLDQQTPFDLPMQANGSFSKVFDFADLNGIGITDLLTVGSMVLADDEVTDIKAVERFTPLWRRPVSAYEQDFVFLQEGIEFWTIGLDFVVS